MNPVAPITGRVLCYHVQSRSDPNTFHMVDWLGEPPYCTCNDHFKTSKKKSEGLGAPYLCHHLIAARDYGWGEYINIAKEHLLAE